MSRERDKSEEQGTATIVRAPSARPLGAVLRVMRDDTAGPTYRLKTGKCVIGSGKSCDLVIADTTVSRTHVELELVPEGVRVHDLGSRNGTFYVGQRIDTMVLGLGSRITIGATPLAIEPDDDHASFWPRDIAANDGCDGLGREAGDVAPTARRDRHDQR